jgi:hypothetical protein
LIIGEEVDEKEKSASIIAWIIAQANNRVGIGADLMPTRDGAIHLPHFNKKWAYLAYCKEQHNQRESMLPSYSYFTRVWREKKHILGKIKTERKVGTLPRCGKCRVSQKLLAACRADDQGLRSRIEKKHRGHIILQGFERRFYSHKKNLAITEPDNFLSCIIDSSSQYVYNCPYSKSTYKGADPGSNLPQSLTAVYFHGRKMFIYPKAKNIGGGSNWTLHCLTSSFFYLFIYLVFPLAQLAGEELAFLCGGCQAYQTIPLTFHKQTKSTKKKKQKKKKKKKREQQRKQHRKTIANCRRRRQGPPTRNAPAPRPPPPEGRRRRL